LSARELAAWRDRLLADGMPSATAVRLCKVTKAAFNLAARRDHRITNTAAWRDGLGGLAEGYASRNVQRLTDDQVRAVIAAATAIDPAFGLYVHVAAETGARLSQIARLTVADLQADNGTPRLMMPGSRKGRSRKPQKRPVPITPELADRLASNRARSAPLLLRADDKAWQSSQDGDHERLYQQAAERAGVTGTMYALRHSSIVRALLAGVPARVVAAVHDTSIGMLERTYSAFIADHADTIARRGLLAAGVTPIRRRAGARP
jgi:integrase